MPDKGKTFAPDNIPDLGDPDRKRALNILAQRRYRQRQREKLRKIGEKNAASASKSPQSSASPTTDGSSSSSTSTSGVQIMQPDSGSLWDESSFVALHYLGPSPDNNIVDLSISNFDPVTFPSDDQQHTSTNAYNVDFVSLSTLDMYPQNNAIDLDLQTSLPSLEVSQFTFPDDSNLEIPMLKTLNVGLAIAERLGIVDILFDATVSHTFSLSQLPSSGLTLPPNLLPTDAQQTIPHFPLLDVLPWPSVRRKLVVIFAQPERLRPPIARDPMGLMHLMHDIDDDAEGVRVVGDRDAFAEKNWEVGQAFFRNWWWALDPQVINESNALRRRRGARPLQMGA